MSSDLPLAHRDRRDESAFCGPARRAATDPLPAYEPDEADRRRAMTVKPPAPPPLPDELDRCSDACDCRMSAERRRT